MNNSPFSLFFIIILLNSTSHIYPLIIGAVPRISPLFVCFFSEGTDNLLTLMVFSVYEFDINEGNEQEVKREHPIPRITSLDGISFFGQRSCTHFFFLLREKKKLIKTSICDCLEMMVLHQQYQLKLARYPYDCPSKDAIIISNNNKIGTETQDHTEMKLFFIILLIPQTHRLLAIFQLLKKKCKNLPPFFLLD